MVGLPAAALRVRLHGFVHEGGRLVEVLPRGRVLEVKEVVAEETVEAQPLVGVVLQQPAQQVPALRGHVTTLGQLRWTKSHWKDGNMAFF